MIFVTINYSENVYLRLNSKTLKTKIIMTVNIQYVGVDVSGTLSDFTEEKLKKMFNRYEFLISATVHFKQDENQHDMGKICNIELSLPGPSNFRNLE